MKVQLNYNILISLTATLLLTACSSNHSLLKCPELASAKHHKTLFAKKENFYGNKESVQSAGGSAHDKNASGLSASTDNKHVDVKIPPLLVRNISTDEDVQALNKLINTYSNNRAGIQRKANGKLYLQAQSKKDLLVTAKNMLNPRGYYEKRYGPGNDGAALAAGVLGVIAFIFAWIPFLNFLALVLGLLAIILGAIGLNSHRQRHAVTGLVLGILAVMISAIFIASYFIFAGWYVW